MKVLESRIRSALVYNKETQQTETLDSTQVLFKDQEEYICVAYVMSDDIDTIKRIVERQESIENLADAFSKLNYDYETYGMYATCTLDIVEVLTNSKKEAGGPYGE